MEVVARRGNSDYYLVANNPQDNQSAGWTVNIETKECWPTSNIQVPIKFGYWEEVENIDESLKNEIMTICNSHNAFKFIGDSDLLN